MTNRPPNWDWVKFEGECSAAIMFGTLHTLAQQNVETRNKQLGRDKFAATEKVLALSAVGAATLRRYGAIDYGPKWHLRPALWRKRLSSQGDTSHHQQRTAQAPTEHRTHAQPMAGELAEPGCSDAGQGWGSGQSFSL